MYKVEVVLEVELENLSANISLTLLC